MEKIQQKAIDAIRILSADMIEKANSGHPGLPLGAAPMAYSVFSTMNHNPKDPNWVNRDRFILSAGHGSAMLYSLLHLFGYPKMSLDQIKEFRQVGSLTPGHPEYKHTPGVEISTGPLGAGLSNAVGFAIAQEHLASIFNKDGYNVVDHYTYALAGDGCMMEGISSEAMSLAGHLGLGKLIVLYDSNKISIEGSTDLAFTENVEKRFEAFNFHIQTVEDGNDIDSIKEAIQEAKDEKSKPSLIIIKTKIGYGVPAKEGKASSHGSPLGEENIVALRETLGWSEKESFVVPEDVYSHYETLAKEGANKQAQWEDMFKEYCEKYPDMKKLWDRYFNDTDLSFMDSEDFWKSEGKPEATRATSGKILNLIKANVPNLLGGSADLAPSNKTYLDGQGDFSKENRSGCNIHYGVRELAMTGIQNGILAHGGLRTFCGTFFVFSDYMKPMMRLASLMNLPAIYVLTHDSIGVGEDGPTHQPIEQLASLRTLPGMVVYRPCDYKETAAAYYTAMHSKDFPVSVVLTRQNLPQMEGSSKEALKGGYVIKKENSSKIDLIIIASGSEVSISVDAANALESKGYSVRVVSMPSMEIFERQDEKYKEEVLPSNVSNRVAVEAGSTLPMMRYTGLKGKVVGIDSFGESGPAGKLMVKYGFTAENIEKVAQEVIKANK